MVQTCSLALHDGVFPDELVCWSLAYSLTLRWGGQLNEQKPQGCFNRAARTAIFSIFLMPFKLLIPSACAAHISAMSPWACLPSRAVAAKGEEDLSFLV